MSIALVTGANSGLGFETAIHLANESAERVIITARSRKKASAAKAQLIEKTGRHVFETLALDLSKLDEVRAAVRQLAERGNVIDVLILNAGLVTGSDTASG